MSSQEKFQPFKVGDWQSREQPSTSKKEEVKLERNYPLFRQYLTTEDFSPIFQLCEQTCIELDRIMRTGSNEAAQAAQLVINAYGRSMQLATELLEIKTKLRAR